MNKNQNLIWIDLEFTGLNYHTNTIVEIACVVTNRELEILGEPVQTVIHHAREDLEEVLEEWPREHFEKSGLFDEIEKSQTSMRQAEQQVLEYVRAWTESGTAVLCGNSVGSDRRVLYKDMSELESHLHYRTIDVSTIKELARSWKPDILDQVDKKESHRALDDILESIEELKLYRKLWLT